MYEYENMRRVVYGDEDHGDALFIPVCPNCGRFVKADKEIRISYRGITDDPNATCKKCGRVAMPCEGFV